MAVFYLLSCNSSGDHSTFASVKFLKPSWSRHLTSTFPELRGLWVIPPNPRLSRYLNLHRTEIDARNAISQSIDAFIIHGVYVSFLLELCRSYPSTSRHITKHSFQDIWEIVKFHPEWINELSRSKIIDAPDVMQRRGCLIEIRSSKWLNLAPYMIKCGLPVWFFWGSSLMPQLRGSWLSSYMPHGTGEEMPQIFMTNDGNLAFPDAHDGSGQLPGETMQAFFDRRRETRLQLSINESPQSREVRMQHVESQARKPSPGRNGPLVYYWQKEGPHKIRMRRVLTQTLADNWWPLWPENCKVYDSFSDQWDCCSDWSFIADDDSGANGNVQQTSGDCNPSSDHRYESYDENSSGSLPTSNAARLILPKEVVSFPGGGNSDTISSPQLPVNATSPCVSHKNTPGPQASRLHKECRL